MNDYWLVCGGPTRHAQLASVRTERGDSGLWCATLTSRGVDWYLSAWQAAEADAREEACVEARRLGFVLVD